MPNVASAVVGVKLTLENGKTVTLHEGDIVQNLVYKVTNITTATITGAVRVINAATTKYNTAQSCPPVPFAHKLLSVGSLVIDVSMMFDADLVRVDISKIVDIGSVAEEGGALVVGPGSQYKSLSDVIADAPAGAMIKLKDGEYTEPLNITKSVYLIGDGDAVFTAPVTIGAMAKAAEGDTTDVHLEGIHFTGKGTIAVKSAIDSLTIQKCSFADYDLTTKTMPVSVGAAVTTPMRLEITDCYFGEQNANSYNLIDVYAPLVSGSQISRNTFAKGCCSHNQISLYGLDKDGVIEISENKVAESQNLVRIGFQGAPVGVVQILENVIDATDEDPDWAGICIVQPYSTKTTDMSGLTVVLSANKNNTGKDQLVYLYNGGSDMKFTDENKPTIEIDGKNVTADVPVRS